MADSFCRGRQGSAVGSRILGRGKRWRLSGDAVLTLPYPDPKTDLNRWLPLVKWLLAIPHYIVLFFLTIGAVLAAIGAWFAILFTGHYPRGLFTYIEGVIRWHARVLGYAILLLSDRYPPFRLGA